MSPTNIKTPGVYINELNAFPNAIAPVETAIPAFIGYTPQVVYKGKSYINVAQKITSFAEFKAIYCLPDPPPPALPSKQYVPQYYLVQQNSQPAKGKYLLIDGKFYSIVPDPNTIYYLYNSIKIFYENGGGDAYIVSVGSYGAPSGNPINPGDHIVNPNVQLNDLKQGLDILRKEQEPTMYICPEATLLSIDNNGILMQQMLLQCSEMQTAMCIFDIIGGNAPDPILYTNDIEAFRNNTGTEGLKNGIAYYPFIGTTMMQMQDIDYSCLLGGDVQKLAMLLNPANDPNSPVAGILTNIQNGSGGLTRTQKNNALILASKTYEKINTLILSEANILPPSGAMAGVITTMDKQFGVWKAPANTSIAGVTTLPIYVTDSQQAYLNVDVVSGKSINAIRKFEGRGIVVWGARTLTGNDNEWRYISVRRTLIFLEQSCKLAVQQFVFEPNNKNTWIPVTGMIENFLTSIWREGGLQGATPKDAFFVRCVLGTTMTAVDVLQGIMIISVLVAMTRPAEFIEFTIRQQQAVSG